MNRHELDTKMRVFEITMTAPTSYLPGTIKVSEKFGSSFEMEYAHPIPKDVQAIELVKHLLLNDSKNYIFEISGCGSYVLLTKLRKVNGMLLEVRG